MPYPLKKEAEKKYRWDDYLIWPDAERGEGLYPATSLKDKRDWYSNTVWYRRAS